jgi:biopolymer transport protein ExbD
MVEMKGLFALAAWLLFVTAAMAASGVIGKITADGAVTIEGQKYSDPVRLKAKLAELASRKPPPALHLNGDPKLPWKTVSAAVTLVQRAGWKLPLGVLTEPSPLKGPSHP